MCRREPGVATFPVPPSLPRPTMADPKLISGIAIHPEIGSLPILRLPDRLGVVPLESPGIGGAFREFRVPTADAASTPLALRGESRLITLLDIERAIEWKMQQLDLLAFDHGALVPVEIWTDSEGSRVYSSEEEVVALGKAPRLGRIFAASPELIQRLADYGVNESAVQDAGQIFGWLEALLTLDTGDTLDGMTWIDADTDVRQIAIHPARQGRIEARNVA